VEEKDDIKKLKDAWNVLFNEIVKALRLDKFLNWLSKYI
jgi:hypothetical protein